MFSVGSFVKITDISECKKVELNEVFKVLSSSKAMTAIENKDGINLGGYYSWRFVAVDPAADAAKPQVANATEDDWAELDETIYADHILRENIDECKSKTSLRSGWERVSGFRNKKLSVYAKTYNFRCRRSALPVADATKSQVADTTKTNATTVADDDWVIIDKSIYGDFELRLTDECNYKNTKWMKVVNDHRNSYNHIYYKDYEFRCKRSDLPVADATKSQVADATITNLCKEVEQQPIPKKDTKMFPVGSFVKITDISNCTCVELNEVFEVLSSNSTGIEIKNKYGKNLGTFCTWRFAVADATKFQVTEPTKITQQDTKMFSNKFYDGQTITCIDFPNDYKSGKLTVGKNYVVTNSNYTSNDGGKFDMVQVRDNKGDPEWFYVYRFSAAAAENTTVAAKQPKRIVAKVTNHYLKKGQSYEVVGYYIPNAESYKVKIDDAGYMLEFRRDCFESDISLSDVTNVDGATSTKENEMKKETAVKVASVVGKFATGWGFRALNYWVFEPAAGIGRPIMKSVRYATFLGSLAALGYGYYHPQEVKDALVSCLPTVSIEAPAILSGK